ncbi:ABC transporter permease [Kibdelosporangium aridum]|uniref:Peptide/nickel transport system permease protein n=1 Tax=Kibdelosporangium aridum TaxID=2030 RepID=A0A1W2FV34_KIBAR|nr:ABC transporter permease [Kibdelosporangium aridum]SMD25496.1 peptide/nickel transport system permease protein [Kibdelosporangium aridum]
MMTFLAKRLAGLVLTLLVASFVVYVSIYLAPGSPENALFGSRQPTPEVRAAVRAHLGLDQGFLTRYWHWITSTVSGDLGRSLISQQPVSDRIGQPMLITLQLVGYAAVLIVIGGVGLGLLAALRPGGVDVAVSTVVSMTTAVPAFVASSVLISIFAIGLGWFPAYGYKPGLVNLTLPAVALAVIASGLVARVTRAEAMEQVQSPHFLTAVARGVSRRRAIRSHVLRNAAGPVVTVIGVQIASLFAGAVVVEQAFGLGGLGQLLISSVQQKDFPVVQAISLIMVVAFVLLNLIAEMTAALIDPRMSR